MTREKSGRQGNGQESAGKEKNRQQERGGDSGKKVKVTLVRGLIGTRESHRATVRGLGLRRINHTVELEDTPSVRGMINKVNYLLKCEA